MKRLKFTVRVESADKFKRLTKDIADSAITLLVVPSGVYFIHFDSQLYILKRLVMINSEPIPNPVAIRILKSDFLNLLIDGTLEFIIEDGELRLGYYNEKGKKLYGYNLTFQEDLLENYIDKINLFSELNTYPSIDFNGAKPIVRMAKSLGVPVCCDGQVIHLNAGALFVYQEFSGLRFTVNSKYLGLIIDHSNIVHSVREYLVMKSGDIVIAVHKLQDVGDSDYDSIKSKGSSHRITLDMSDLIFLAKKVKVTKGDFIFDMYRRKAKFISGTSVFIADLDIKDVKRVKYKDNPLKSIPIPTLKIPGAVFKSVFANFKAGTEVIINIKKDFVEVRYSNLIIVFSKEVV